jgi:DNA-binding transcriptional ArsR family regulator
VVVRSPADHGDDLFQALADATRRDILAVVLGAERSVSELACRYPMSFAAVQKHVAVLERAGLVVKRRHGREQRVRGRPEALREVHDLIDQLEMLWRARIDRIDEILSEGDPP